MAGTQAAILDHEIKDIAENEGGRALRQKGPGFQMIFPICPYNPGLDFLCNYKMEVYFNLLKAILFGVFIE